MSLYLGANQLGECVRCGVKTLAKFLTYDGYNPRSLVCGECWDPRHPAEQPFVPRQREGKAKYPIAPENLPPLDVVLESVFDEAPLAWLDDPLSWETAPLAWLEGSWSTGGGASLTWSRPNPPGARFEYYDIFRSVEDASFMLLATNEIEYNDFMQIQNEPELYTDVSIGANSTYRYYIEAVTANGLRARSNTITIDIGDVS